MGRMVTGESGEARFVKGTIQLIFRNLKARAAL